MHPNEGGGHMSTEQANDPPAGYAGDPLGEPISPLGTSILDDIRAIREARIVADQPRLVTNVPQYEERLAIIHRFPEGGAERLLDAVNAETSATSYDQRIEGACKQLVQTCAAVVVRNPEGKLVDPDTGALLGPDEKPELPEHPMLFDRRCAETFKIEIPPEVKGVGVFVCRNLFSPRGQSHTVYDGDIALINTSNGVYAWLNGARLAADEDAAGE